LGVARTISTPGAGEGRLRLAESSKSSAHRACALGAKSASFAGSREASVTPVAPTRAMTS
jgi:hypothetical protein